ncbi:MAG: thioredoxin family protein [Chitinophagaceae bacterium]|nr:thioredoxin family protein [Chitinophagaceae bacterium]MCW5914194.1 thioredoxin family protein [Chitinophagaceae bacterium]MCZ2395116.1 thioredoxin family protein [Chitinophagales bacterium]
MKLKTVVCCLAALCMLKNAYGFKYMYVTQAGYTCHLANPAIQDTVLPEPIGSTHQSITSDGEDTLANSPKYYTQIKQYLPEVMLKNNLKIYPDYDEALAASRKFRKPLMLHFTAIYSINCRIMEAKVWAAPEIIQILKDSFIIAPLFVDAHDVYIPENERYYSSALNRKVNTPGERNSALQISNYDTNAQPYTYFLNIDGKKLIPEGYGFDESVEKFRKILEKALIKYHKLHS